ncbi:gliding motility-associated C-terminal domain-containing protein, partial [Myroides odoratimimus]
MNTLYKYCFFTIIFLTVTKVSLAQSTDSIFVNKGSLMFVASETIVSTEYSFENTKEGNVISDGVTYYYNNFHNDGYYSISETIKSGKAVFTKYENKKGKQVISGSKPSDFYHVVFY